MDRNCQAEVVIPFVPAEHVCEWHKLYTLSLDVLTKYMRYADCEQKGKHKYMHVQTNRPNVFEKLKDLKGKISWEFNNKKYQLFHFHQPKKSVFLPTKKITLTVQWTGGCGWRVLQWVQMFHVAGYAIGWMKIMLMCRWNWWRCIYPRCWIAQAIRICWTRWWWWQSGCCHSCYCRCMTRCKEL